jgi:hypothetical protein
MDRGEDGTSAARPVSNALPVLQLAFHRERQKGRGQEGARCRESRGSEEGGERGGERGGRGRRCREGSEAKLRL